MALAPDAMGAAGTAAGAAYVLLLYVAPLYLSRKLPRSHPRTVWRRMATSLLTTGCLAWVPLYRQLGAALGQAPTAAQLLGAMGVRGPGLAAACALPLALTAALFAGPLAMAAVDAAQGAPREALPPLPLALRNFAAAPATEEAAFRGCLLPFLLLRGASPAAAAVLSPAVFGAAHLHHLHDLVAHQGWPLRSARLAVLFQAAYSSVFGAYAALLLLRTGHLAAPVLAHAFCNFMGLPRLGHLRRYPRGVAAAFVAGIAAFAGLLWPLTRPGLYGYAPGASYTGELQALAAARGG